MQQAETSPEKIRHDRIEQMIEYAEKLISTPKYGFPTSSTSKQSFRNYIGLEAVRRFGCTWMTGDDYALVACLTVFARRGWTF